jgi:hypothetical protein
MQSHIKITAYWFLIMVLIAFATSSAYAQFSPQNFEGTHNLKPKQIELSSNYSFNYFPLNITKDDYANSVGVSVKVGLHQQIDIKVDYSWLFSTYGDNIWHVVQIGPRFSNKDGRIAFRLPLGITFDQREKFPSDTIIEYDINYFISARMLFGVVKKQYFEMMLNPMAEVFFSNRTLFLTGIDMGFGFSSDFSWWSIRPEGTILIDSKYSNDFIWKVGLSASIIIGGRKSRKQEQNDYPLYLK